jgi:hypothetical protein
MKSLRGTGALLLVFVFLIMGDPVQRLIIVPMAGLLLSEPGDRDVLILMNHQPGFDAPVIVESGPADTAPGSLHANGRPRGGAGR